MEVIQVRKAGKGWRKEARQEREKIWGLGQKGTSSVTIERKVANHLKGLSSPVTTEGEVDSTASQN